MSEMVVSIKMVLVGGTPQKRVQIVEPPRRRTSFPEVEASKSQLKCFKSQVNTIPSPEPSKPSAEASNRKA